MLVTKIGKAVKKMTSPPYPPPPIDIKKETIYMLKLPLFFDP